ncbi:hypothetical protein AALB16_11455 [Lachnospiraceae bacterium 62-35]
MDSFQEKVQRLMAGRYGMDAFGRFLHGMIMVLILVNLFVKSDIVWFLEIVLLIYSVNRMFSKNFTRRQKENNLFQRYGFYVSEQWKRWKYKGEQALHYRIFKCPGCSQKIRIPRGKGRISIHCPKCHTDFIRRS